ncbi:hypothetical protein CC1G_01263 [Coprinopsis cinerea okayama7|uniref:Golgi apparatus membrane protein TVP38 n=1 Tax=Coprinopsis cinerea (strain Okayama-7 / 130 / ATCC MYA-4618 / FGSC 9003) TaxID=240176 RepID=A8NY60_COPC7|nr:hypothetical protein CC1G_01263 [Coprinopsis cinerea okayama7\|eukprot:XP_001837351.2 hypothetical protein CC1G_01263 [Coprinopsis cinerea okayama7\
MAHTDLRRAPSVDLISLATPIEEYNEKVQSFHHQNLPLPSSRPGFLNSSSRQQRTPSSSYISSQLPPKSQFTNPSRPSHNPARPSHDAPPLIGQPQLQPSSRSFQNPTTRPPKGPRIVMKLKPWIPMILYALTSFAFVVAIALYRTELFTLLDELSLWLRSDEEYGHAILFFLIFLTTIPPIPLYSTLIVLSGYTFGTWMGAIISYFSALFGALVVFIVSRALFRESIGKWLNSYTSIKRVVRAIEKRPKLLFLIRFAPYPYNVLNCLLAASPTLTLHTYTVCTALSLFKVVIHTSIGASIHSFKDFHVADPDSTDDEGSADWLAQMWTLVGIALCAAILVYLYIVARRAVDEELDDEPPEAQDAEETRSFLSSEDRDLESGYPASSQPMTEVPFSPNRLMTPTTPYRSSFDLTSDSLSGASHRQWP